MTNEEIVSRIQEGEDLYELLIENNQGLFRSIHKDVDYFNLLEEEDVLSVCYLCLIRCVKRWDKRKGIQFVTFLYPSITREIKRLVKREWNQRNIQECSLDFQITVGDGEASQVMDLLKFKEKPKEFKSSYSDTELIKAIALKHLKTLPPKQRQIACDYFLKGIGQVELSKRHNLCQYTISRMLNKIRKSAKNELTQNGIELSDFHRAMNQ